MKQEPLPKNQCKWCSVLRYYSFEFDAELVYVEDNTKLQERVIYFSNKTYWRKISADGAQYCDTFFSDHEDADTKLEASVKGYGCSNTRSCLYDLQQGI